MLRFAAGGLLAVAVVALVGALILRRISMTEAERDARQLTELAARAVIGPNLTPAVLASDPEAMKAFDQTLRERALVDPVVRIKIWTPEGTILYSDNPAQIGTRFPLGDDGAEALREKRTIVERATLDKPENVLDRDLGDVVEVYLPLWSPDGKTFLLETYQRTSSIAQLSNVIWRAFVPPFVAALLVLSLVQLPLAWSLARALRRGHAEREDLLRRAIDASDAERRRIAGDLHDGVVQDLAGVSYSLSAAADRLATSPAQDLEDSLQSAARRTREAMRQLRAVLVEIYPPNLSSAGLEPALTDLLAPLQARGIDATIEIPPGLRLDTETEQLVFRVAREAIRNVVEHAHAAHVNVRVDMAGDAATLTVDDDGRGVNDQELERRRGEGHMGLVLLQDRAADLGARLSVERAPIGGTRIRLEVAR